MSIEDKKFVEIMDLSVCVQEGHYCMDSFNKDNIIVPNNRCIVEQRMQSLKRRLERKKEYKEEYTEFLTNLIDKGYAEVVPYGQLEPKDGSVWYLPHHSLPLQGKKAKQMACKWFLIAERAIKAPH